MESTKKQLYFRLLSFFMALILCISSTSSVFAKDSLENWSDKYMKTLAEQNIYESIMDSYDAKRTITYVEFIEMAAKLFHYDKLSQIQSQTVTLQNWFAENITDIAVKKADQTLTRQDAVVMLAKMLKYDLKDSEKSKFKDDSQIADYARSSVNALTKKGHLNGYLDGTLKPQNPISFGEVASLLCSVAGSVYSEGTHDFNNQTIQGNLSIVSPGVVLKNAVIEGDLYISEGVGTGEVTLNHVVVKGETIVSGGGINSILFIDTQLGTLRVEVPDNVPVRVVASGNTNINMTEVRSGSKLQTDNLSGDGFQGIVVAIPDNSRVSLEGTFPSVVVDSPKAKVDILGGKAENIVITEKATEAKVNIASTATVSSMEINAQATVGGTGKLESVSISSQNVSIAQSPDNIDIKDGITSDINNNNLNGGTYSNYFGSSSDRKHHTYNSSNNNPPNSGDDSNNEDNPPNKPEDKKELTYSYVETSQTETDIFVNMFFDEPIELLVNGKALSGNDLNNLFTYQSDNGSGTIEDASLSETYLSFRIPKEEKSNTYQISLEEKNWTLRGKNSKKEFLSNPFLKFTISNSFPFVVNGPDDMTVFAGEKASFKVDVETTEKLNYQWYRNGTEIAGATESSYSFITGLSDSGNKFSVKVWLNYPNNIREIVVNNNDTVVLTVESKQNATVILEEGSEGIAGDGCITDLQLGYRYYIIAYKDGRKSYPVMKDGTLGTEATEILYENLEPLETTTISGLTNEEKYRVVKVLADTPVLQSLIISGLTNTVNFLGYVPKTMEGEIPLLEKEINLKAISDSEDALINVSYKIGEEEQNAWRSDDSYIVYLDDASIVDITITVSPQSEPENQSVYKIMASRAAEILVTRPGYSEEDTDIVYIYNKSNIEYNIKYMKPTEKFEGITFKKNDDTTTITLQENKHYTQETLYNGVILIKFTQEFADTLVPDDVLEFTFKFSGGTTKEKICKAKIYQDYIPPYNVKFGEPELIPGDDWLNIFVPVTKENGEAIDDMIKDIISYADVKLYKDDIHIYSVSSNLEVYEQKEQKGILVSCGLYWFSMNLIESLPNKYQVDINYYKVSEDTSSRDFYTSSKAEIPEGEAINGEEYIAFSGDNPPVPSKISENRYTLNLAKENIPFNYGFQTGEEEIFYHWSETGHTIMTDNNGKDVDLYMASEEPELACLFAHMNCVPQLLMYDYEGEAVIDGDFITRHDFYISNYSSLIYNFYFNYYVGNQYQSFSTVKDLKVRHLNPEDIQLTIGEKADGTPLEKTMQEFLDAGYFDGTSDETDIGYLQFAGVKELFAAFGVNPLKDTIHEQITSHAELNGIPNFQLGDVTYDWYENKGALTEIIIKDKNGENSITCDINQEEIVIPYAEAAIATKSSGGYECVIYDEDAIPVDSKGLIMTPGVPTPIAVVIAQGGVKPKVYKFNLIYEPEVTTFSMREQEAEISFIQLTDDMEETEIEDILKSLESDNFKEDFIADETSNELLNNPSENVTDESSESVTDESSESVTDEPSESVTDESSESATDESSESVTDESSESVTDESSESATDEPSESATDEPSESATDESSNE